jgi:hypothetical protein
MSIKLLGDLLFPRLAPWQRRKQAKILIGVVAASLIFGAVVLAIILVVNQKH